jgi:hypothetical protein
MATIKARRQANGSLRYTAIVRRRVGKTIVHREAKTLMHRSAAVSGARHRKSHSRTTPCQAGRSASRHASSQLHVGHGGRNEAGCRTDAGIGAARINPL